MKKASVCCLTKYIKIRGGISLQIQIIKNRQNEHEKNERVLLDKIMIFWPLKFVIYYMPNNIRKLFSVQRLSSCYNPTQ